MVEFLYQNDIHGASDGSPASATLKFSRFLNASCCLSSHRICRSLRFGGLGVLLYFGFFYLLVFLVAHTSV